MDATIERGSTSVDLPLLSTGGTPQVSVDIGKPNLNIQTTGAINPRHIDQWSVVETYSLLGRFVSDTAYSDAIELADLIKGASDGTEMTLDMNFPELNTPFNVAPAAGQEEALNIVYPPGRRNNVEIDLGLTRIAETIGGADQTANTPTASGTGPIQITDGSTTVDLTDDVEVTRAVGRPKSNISKRPSQLPTHIETHKTAYDAFSLSFEYASDPVTPIQNLRELFGTRLGRNSLTLDFNGLYGMGAFNVVPDSSQAIRHTRPSGEQGTSLVPTINLRRVI